MRIAVVANSAWYLHNFRRRLMARLRDEGHDVVALSPPDAYAERLRAEGFAWEPWPLSASSTSPWSEGRAVMTLRALLRRHRVTLAFTYTPKGNIYTGLAVRGLGVAHIPNVSGLGSGFLRRGLLAGIMTRLYAIAFARARAVVFQNDDDRAVFLRAGLVDKARTLRVPGSGVDVDRFQPAAWCAAEPPVFLFIGRILRDKGAREYVAAATALRSQGISARFQMLGSVAADNPTAIPEEEWRQWAADGIVELLGNADDVRPFIAAAHCVVLPSYREGMPRVLLEAAAMARPCIATDVPGCRDAVVHEATGYLCPAGDASALAASMTRLLEIGPSAWRQFGERGRQHVVQHYDEQLVLDLYSRLAAGASAGSDGGAV